MCLKIKKKERILFIVFLIFLGILLLWQFRKSFYTQVEQKKETVSKPVLVGPSINTAKEIDKKNLLKVVYVIDGDTIIVEGGQKVRYIGVDTPETKHPKKEVQCFGKEAFSKNKDLVLNKYVYLEKDISETDRYKRLLRYVWLYDLPTASNSSLFINDYLARQGYARLATFPPDVKYADQFRQAEKEARENNRGLWKECLTVKTPN